MPIRQVITERERGADIFTLRKFNQCVDQNVLQPRFRVCLCDLGQKAKCVKISVTWSYPVSVDGGGLADDCFE